MATKFWYFLVVVIDCIEWTSWSQLESWFWVSFDSYFSAACHGLLMEPETGRVGPTLQKNQEDPNFLSCSGGNCGQTELVMLYKWSQEKVNDGALLLNLKDSCTGGLKQLLGNAGTGYFPLHHLLILGHPRKVVVQPPARLKTIFSLPQERLFK